MITFTSILLIANVFLYLYGVYGIFEIWWNSANPSRMFRPLLRMSLSVMAFLVMVIGGSFAIVPAYIALTIYVLLLMVVVFWYELTYGGE